MAKEKEKKDEEAKEEGKEGGGEAAPAPKKGKKKLFIIIGAVLLLGLAAGVPLMMMGGGGDKDKDKDSKQDAQTPQKELLTAPLDTFIVNLSETGAFLKVKMLFEYDGSVIQKAEADLVKKGVVVAGGESKGDSLSGYLKLREPMIRDTVIKILSAKRSNEVLSQDGKEKLKEELIEGLNEAIGLDEGPVQNIYFTEFIIQ